MRMRFLAITQPFFVQSGWIFYGNSLYYYLSIGGEKSCFLCCFEKNHIFGRTMGVQPPRWRQGSGTSRPDQKLAQWVDFFGQPLSRKHVFKIFGPEPPPPLSLIAKIYARCIHFEDTKQSWKYHDMLPFWNPVSWLGGFLSITMNEKIFAWEK